MKHVVLDTDIHRDAKVVCATKNITMRDFINNAVRKELGREQRKLDKAS